MYGIMLVRYYYCSIPWSEGSCEQMRMMIANGSDSLVWKVFIIESEQEVYSMVYRQRPYVCVRLVDIEHHEFAESAVE